MLVMMVKSVIIGVNHSNYAASGKVYIFNCKDPASILLGLIFSLYGCLNLGPSDPEADGKLICHRASFLEELSYSA